MFDKPLKDAFVEECELIRSDMLENDLAVEGEFATEETMRDEWKWSELLSCLVQTNFMCCAVRPCVPPHWFPFSSHVGAFRARINAVKADARKSPRTLMRRSLVCHWGVAVFVLPGAMDNKNEKS